MAYKCDKKPHKWTKWELAGWNDIGGAIEFRRCKWCGKREHREIAQVTP